MKDNKIKAKVKPEEKKEESKEEKSDEKSSEEKKDGDEAKKEAEEAPKEEQEQFFSLLVQPTQFEPTWNLFFRVRRHYGFHFERFSKLLWKNL